MPTYVCEESPLASWYKHQVQETATGAAQTQWREARLHRRCVFQFAVIFGGNPGFRQLALDRSPAPF
jgi:hypothetical protein